ncbi:hypothetical protein QM588_19230 [Rhodococcus sp. IEGM 1354]|uniref:hypothetical protein n=1 Tax=Rhodococcus sp. IEGM 1354 TaxID=3047088 RepID=UPI0024B83FAF|nr:hypothetical protein [Rhodococcus sp. IEGM 1354]MDI9932554.1 hypothetical protein [Rhodococcus sp. IEGM 1354]
MRIDMRRGGVRIDAVVVAAIVAVGCVAAGITLDSPEVGDIPGCDVVVPAGETFSFFTGSYPGKYDNPDYPWLTAEKASAMSESLVRSLPTDVEVEFASPSNSLVFQPMQIYSKKAELSGGMTVEDLSGDSTASGVVDRAGVAAPLQVSAEAWDDAIPPCTEGSVDERIVLPDGTVVDALDAVSEYDGVSTHRRTATAYFPDTIVHARTSNEGDEAELPLEADELRDIVSNPELRVSARVPEGTKPARADCGPSREYPVPPLPRDVVERIGSALQARWETAFPNTSTDIAVGDLMPGTYGSGSACNAVVLTSSRGTAQVNVEISVEDNVEWPDDPDVLRSVLPDGTVVTRRSDMRTIGTEPTEWLSVLRPSNTLVQFRFDDTIAVESLVELATAPGLDL